MSTQSRITGAFASNVVGYVANILIQFGTVPALLFAWGPDLFGEWLLVTTVPSYLTLSDFGLGSAVGNDMALSVAANDRPSAISSFHSVTIAYVLIGLCFLLPIYVFLTNVPIGQALGIRQLSHYDLTQLLGLLLIQLWLGMQIGLLGAGFRCEGYYPLSGFLLVLQRIAEFIALVATAFLGYGPVGCAAAIVVTRLVFIALMMIILRSKVPWLKFGFSHANFERLRPLGSAGAGFLLLPIAAAINLQTPLLIIGSFLGPSAVVIFSTTRTISRIIQALTNVINSSISAEITRGFGLTNIGLVRRLFRIAVVTSLFVGIGAAIFLAIAGPWLYQFWTHRFVEVDRLLLYLLLIVMIANTFWFTASIALTGTNRSLGLGTVYLLTNLVVMPFCWLLCWTMGLHGVALGLIFCELPIACYVLPASFSITGETAKDFLHLILSPPEVVEMLRPVLNRWPGRS